MSGGRVRAAGPTCALILGGLSLVSGIAVVILDILEPAIASPGNGATGVVAIVAWFVFGVSFTAVGVVVARRQPHNPMGWLLIAASLAIQGGTLASGYAYLDYHSHHGTLPLGHLALLFAGAWAYGFIATPLIILLFPDGRVGPRMRWTLRVFLGVCAVFTVGLLIVTVNDFGLSEPVDASGNLVGLGNPTGWFAPVFFVGFSSCMVLSVVAVVYQARGFRRAGGERRQQLKWLGAGSAICVVFLLITLLWKSAPALVGNVLFPLALTTLPLAIGLGILRYRLYEIDRLVSRTVAYAVLTALLAGTFVGLVALSTDVLAFSSSVGVAASTLAAAALFSPLRGRVQRIVDRRFNRAQYDAAGTVAAFAAKLRDAVDLDAVQAELLDVVQRAVEPAHATVWIRPTVTTRPGSTPPDGVSPPESRWPRTR